MAVLFLGGLGYHVELSRLPWVIHVPERARFQDLIRRVRNRDQNAARELAATYEGAIRRVVRVRMRDAQMRKLLDSDDVCQSVLGSFFVRAALGQFELETPDQLIGLLCTMARNTLANQAERLRAQRRDIRRETSIGDDDVLLVDGASSPVEQVSARELLERVRSRLSREERQLAEQRAQGRTWPEIAADMNGSADALRKQFDRAIDRVMKELGVEDGCRV